MSQIIEATKSHLEHMIPNAKDISIKVERDHEQFVSKIHVQLPGGVFHAQKKAPTIWEAIDYSYNAIMKQFERLKFKKISKNKKISLKEHLRSPPP